MEIMQCPLGQRTVLSNMYKMAQLQIAKMSKMEAPPNQTSRYENFFQTFRAKLRKFQRFPSFIYLFTYLFTDTFVSYRQG